MVKPLIVYKASAGSGKTFTLATEYIKLLVQNPMAYRNILAVTFTNKATEEMKMRILSQLYGIAHKLPASDSYLQRVRKDTGLSDDVISQRAGEALHQLLHHFNYFRVETIDTFFQSVLRNLARELDLTANLRIGLNDIQVEEQAVDQLIDRLTHTDVMLQWLLKYIMESISDNRSWNVIGKVKNFGRTIFRDYYKEQSKALREKTTDEHFFDSYTRQLRDIRKSALNEMRDQSEKFFETLDEEGLTVDDLSNGKAGVAGFFIKIKNGVFDESIVGKRVADCAANPEKWCAKTHRRREDIIMLADSVLIPLLRRCMDARPKLWSLYQSADLTLRHLNQLRLLGSIEQKVRDLNEASNRFLLSDTQQFLHALISDNDSPFIFEKIGTQLEHIMIDEFQDTSTVQWQNFKVLLRECMSHAETESLIVGDVKQSIYRWRSGDWRLLNSIDKEFPNPSLTLDIRPLEINYRSERRIIDFNNTFFSEAAQQEYNDQRDENPRGAEQLRHAYEDVVQQVPAQRDNSGYVNISLLTKDNYQEETLQQLAAHIQLLMERGISARQMAIIVRTNKVIPLIAEYFAHHLPEVRIVSDEAFKLNASVATTIITTALHLLTHPDDQLARATLAKLYQRSVLGCTTADNELLIRDQPLDELLPQAFTQHTGELLQLPLYELAERLYTIFQLDSLNEQSAYICAFYDQLTQFTQDDSTDIDAFVEEWQESIGAKTIQAEETDGIRILTIHKSKGLEFDHVLLPFCDWRMELPDVLWCQPTEPPFDALPIAPIDYGSKQMRGTIYEQDYLDEHLQNAVDNLNLLYVAFTRAARSLFVIGRRAAKNTRSELLEKVLPKLRLEDSAISGVEDETEAITFTYGTLPQALQSTTDEQANGKTKNENPFLASVTPTPISIETFEQKTEFRQSNKSRDFIVGDDEQQALSYIKIGSVLHEIFSTIRTTADIDAALQRLQSDGVLYDDEVTREKVQTMLRKRLEDVRVRNWFSNSWQLFNECSILRLDEQGHVVERRPDRVMTDGTVTHVVDFKFGSPKPKYQQQVQEYMLLLSQMGMPKVKGWLWYVYSNKIEEVKP